MGHHPPKPNWEKHKDVIIKASLASYNDIAKIAAKYQIGVKILRRKLTEWGVVAAAPGNEERNAKIVEMGRQGMRPTTVARQMKLSRGVVIGVLDRAGLLAEAGKSQRTMTTQANAAQAARKKILLEQQKAGRNAKRAREGKPPEKSKLAPIVPDTKSRPNLSVKARFTPLEAPPEVDIPQWKHARPGGVTLADRTGCAWPLWGNERMLNNDDYRYCNEPRGQRYDCFGKIETLDYCSRHWNIGHTGRALKPLNLTKRHMG